MNPLMRPSPHPAVRIHCTIPGVKVNVGGGGGGRGGGRVSHSSGYVAMVYCVLCISSLILTMRHEAMSCS